MRQVTKTLAKRIFFIMFFIVGCSSNNNLTVNELFIENKVFDLLNFTAKNHKDSSQIAVKLILQKDFKKAALYSPHIFKINLNEDLNEDSMYRFSNVISDKIAEQIPEKSEDFMVFACMLRYKYKCDIRLYEILLKEAYRLDSNNYLVLSLLANDRILYEKPEEGLYILKYLAKKTRNEQYKAIVEQLETEGIVDTFRYKNINDFLEVKSMFLLEFEDRESLKFGEDPFH